MNLAFRRVLVILLSLLLLTSACQPTPPTVSPLTGSMSEISGAVNSKTANATEFSPVALGTILQVNDQVQTGDDGRARIDLSSGTLIRLTPSSLFTLQSNEEAGSGLSTTSKLDIGRIFIILKGGSLDVETPSGVASVRGSYMMVEVAPNQDVIVTCLEGNCSAGNPAGSQNFTNGQKVTLFHADPSTGQYRPPFLEDMSEEDYQKWLDENPDANEMVRTVQSEKQEPTVTPSPLPTATLVTIVPSTETPSASAACLNIIQPPNEASLPFDGPVNFQWEPLAGAAQYSVTFHFPNGSSQPFTTSDTELTRYMDTLPDGGIYQWEITALDGSGNPICTTQGFSFVKPSSLIEDLLRPTKTEKPPRPTQEPRCTVGQWVNPNAPCYCDEGNYPNLPPYCYQGGY